MDAQKAGLLWLYPIIILVMQLAPPALVLLCGVCLVAAAAFCVKIRPVLLLFGFTAIGHCAWVYFMSFLAHAGVAAPISVVVGRLGLLGYLIVFLIWSHRAPTRENYVKFGDVKAKIQFPFIWWGREEPIWRFLLIFCTICGIPILVLAINGTIRPEHFLLGLGFVLLNATLEELLWRGLILPRVSDLLNERQALVITALAFGVYHISLGFPLWACLIFAIGGYYMGGSAAVSRGLFPPWIMHIAVNLIFAFAGFIV